jgi:hypothetical protein
MRYTAMRYTYVAECDCGLRCESRYRKEAEHNRAEHEQRTGHAAARVVRLYAGHPAPTLPDLGPARRMP